jgi:hypothetical protein
MISLPTVTLYAFTSIEFDATIRSLLYSSKDINFGIIKLISDTKPRNLPEKIQWEYAPKINNIDDFNHYMFLEMGKHIQTSHALYVQHHAWVLDASLWDDGWLSLDYLGAPWPIRDGSYMANDGTRSRVGNDGFSLKSKRLLDIPKQMGWHLREEQGWKNVDGQVCCYWKKELLEFGIKYAPVEIAAKFSYENDVPENLNIKKFFGFHKNLPRQ